MWKYLVLMLSCAVCAGAEEKPRKEPRQKEREAAIKALKVKMAPIEKKLASERLYLAFAKLATVNGGSDTGKEIAGRQMPLSFATKEMRQKDIENSEAAVKKLNDQLEPLQKELKELQKQVPKPDVKPQSC